MLTTGFNNLRIAGITAVAPRKYEQAHDYDDNFGKDIIAKNIKITGIQQAYQLEEHQAPSDLAYIAAKNLICKLDIAPASIGVLVFVSPYLDYVIPATACVLHGRLGLAKDCMAFDMDLGCSGYVYGLAMVASLLQSLNTQRGLLLTAEIGNRVFSPLDKSRLLFGAGGAATLLEKCDTSDEFHFGMNTDGTRFKAIIMPAGGYRNSKASHERSLWGDGNIRSDYDSFINGPDVFSFSTSDVPDFAREFLEYYKYSIDDFDSFILHQPNLFILKRIIKKLGIPYDRMPLSLDRYGNTGASSIPLTICDAYHEDTEKRRFFIYGFGVGLSWACASISVDTRYVYAIEHTDDYFKNGAVPHN